MRKNLSLAASLLSLLMLAPSVQGARTRAAEEKPIITIKCDAYQVVGAENAFGLMLGATETDYFDIDCGFGSQELEVEPWRVENGAITGTYASVRVSEEGIIRIYGDASKIDMIQLQGGYATEIEMAQCTNLEVLDLSHNTLKSLDLTPFTKLYAIYLSDNPFTKETPLKVGVPKDNLSILEIDIIDHLDQSFNLSDYPAMQAFDAYHNLDLWNLDPTGCPELLSLTLEVTNVSSLDVSKNPKLRNLNVSDTRIATLDLSNNPELISLMAEHASGFINKGYYIQTPDLSLVPKLQVLYLGGNNLTEVDLSKNPALTNINLRHNKLTSLDLSKNGQLYSINIIGNDMDFATLPAPEETWGEYFYMQNAIPVARAMSVDDTLDLAAKVLRPGTETYPTVWVKAIDGNDTQVDESLYTYADGKIKFTRALPDSVYVKYHNSLLSDYPLSTTPFLLKTASELGMPSQAVQLVAAANGTFSARVGMYGASAQTPKTFLVDFGDGQKKEFSTVSGYLPESVNLSGTVTAGSYVTIYIPEGEVMTALAIENQPLTSINVQAAPELRVLKINGTGLSDIDLRYNRCLETLDLSANSLATLDLTGIYANWDKHVLTDFNASSNQLTEVIVASPRQIQRMNLSDNKITEFSLKDYDQLLDLDLSGNLLSDEVSLAYLGGAENINISNNNIKRVVYDSFSALRNFDLSGNKLTIETLPYQPGAENYVYAPQQPLEILKNAPAVNLSDQNRVLLNGKGTTFTWKKADGTLLVEGTDMTCTDGATRFLKDDLGLVYCEMSNPAFPEFSGADIFRTTDVNIVGAPTTVVATFTTTEDATDGELIIASPVGTALYVDWRGDGSEFMPYEATKEDFYNGYENIRTYKDAKVTVYTYDSPTDIDVFSLYNIKMSEFNGEPLTALKALAIGGAALPAEKATLPAADLREFTFSGNGISAYPWMEKYPNLQSLNLSNNEFTSFDASPLKELQVFYMNSNRLTDVTFDNPLIWEVGLVDNQLESVDLSGLKRLSQIWLGTNKLSEINLVPFRGTLTTLNLTNNKFTFATLPVPTDYPRLVNYTYGNQAYVEAEISDDYMTFDLSSVAVVKDMYDTEYTWFLGEPVFNADDGTLSGETLIVDDEYTIENGVTTFNTKFPDDVVCVMTNSLFPSAYLRTPAYRVGYDSAVNAVVNPENERVDVYTISGMIVKRQVKRSDALNELPAGLYILGGKKVIVK